MGLMAKWKTSLELMSSYHAFYSRPFYFPESVVFHRLNSLLLAPHSLLGATRPYWLTKMMRLPRGSKEKSMRRRSERAAAILACFSGGA